MAHAIRGSINVAVVEAAKAELFRRDQRARNIFAGMIVGVVALPFAMAFAIASGVKPEMGICTAIVAGLVVSLFGGSGIQIGGPTGAFIVTLAGITVQHGVDGMLLATMMAGIILVLLGVDEFGGVMRFIPNPVIVGFTAGIGVIIWVGHGKTSSACPPRRKNASTRKCCIRPGRFPHCFLRRPSWLHSALCLYSSARSPTSERAG